MARKFRDAVALLNDLLDRYEAGVANVRAYPDHDGFADITAADRFDRDIRRAANAGLVKLVMPAGRHRDRVTRVDLINATDLYTYLKRSPAGDKAQLAATEVFADLALESTIEAIGQTAIEAWSRNKRWSGLTPGDTGGLRNALMLAQSLATEAHRGMDYRTFSRRVTGDFKELERLEQPVLRLLSLVHNRPFGANARSLLSELGLDRFGPPLLLRGPVAFDGSALPSSMPYIGLPAREYGRLSLTRTPSYILSIENQTSFNRQVMEVDPESQGVVLYTGGYPSLDIQRAIGYLATTFPDVPFFHWSDIDPEGTWIFRTVERAAGRKVVPHLMSAALAEAKGTPLPGRVNLRSPDAEGSAILDLVQYFETPGAKWLEQEELDPQMPR